jgi:transcription initiation factor TFIID subunit 1, fungi type
LTPEDEERYNRDDTIPPKPLRRQSTALDSKPQFGSPIPQTPGPIDPTSPSYSRASSLAREREGSVGPEQRRVLRIKRFVSSHEIRDISINY